MIKSFLHCLCTFFFFEQLQIQIPDLYMHLKTYLDVSLKSRLPRGKTNLEWRAYYGRKLIGHYYNVQSSLS